MTGFSGSKRRSSESCIRWGRFPFDPAELLQKQKSLKLYIQIYDVVLTRLPVFIIIDIKP